MNKVICCSITTLCQKCHCNSQAVDRLHFKQTFINCLKISVILIIHQYRQYHKCYSQQEFKNILSSNFH